MVAGHADLLIAPKLGAGNTLAGQLAFMSDAEPAGVDAAFLRHPFDLGRERAGAFLARHVDDLGQRSCTDVAAKSC